MILNLFTKEQIKHISTFCEEVAQGIDGKSHCVNIFDAERNIVWSNCYPTWIEANKVKLKIQAKVYEVKFKDIEDEMNIAFKNNDEDVRDFHEMNADRYHWMKNQIEALKGLLAYYEAAEMVKQ